MADRLKIITDAAAMRTFSRDHRKAGRSVAFVPTMGNLHEGHIALVEAARGYADVVVASIYVNPTQFAKNEDFDRYPSSREADRIKLQAAGCHAVFEPASLYKSPSQSSDASKVVGVSGHTPGDHETFIQVEYLQQGLCGKSRPTFFRGVATVVAKLFHIVEPDFALFGRKDYQQSDVCGLVQWRLLQRMVRDLDFAIEIIGLPIVREPDGLAMSSRNNLLTPEQRQQGLCIYKVLHWAAAEAAAGGITGAQQLAREIESRITAGGGRVDYVEVVDATELQPVTDVSQQPLVIAVAAFFGSVRLIDNIEIGCQ